MIRTHAFRCELARATADALNAESGRIYTEVLIEHYRVWRKHEVWLSGTADERMNDGYNGGQPRLLHAHSIDAAQQGFAKACQATRVARKAGFSETRMPYKQKHYRTTVWKNSGIRLDNGQLLLALARGLDAIQVQLPKHLLALSKELVAEVRLVYEVAHKQYQWHVVIDDGQAANPVTTGRVAAGDLGEVHPIALTDGQAAVVISCRQLRAQSQHTNHRLASLQAKQAGRVRGSRRWRRLQARKQQQSGSPSKIK